MADLNPQQFGNRTGKVSEYDENLDNYRKGLSKTGYGKQKTARPGHRPEDAGKKDEGFIAMKKTLSASHRQAEYNRRYSSMQSALSGNSNTMWDFGSNPSSPAKRSFFSRTRKSASSPTSASSASSSAVPATTGTKKPVSAAKKPGRSKPRPVFTGGLSRLKVYNSLGTATK